MACERNNVNPDNTNDNFNNDTSSYKPKVVNNAVTDIEGNVYDAVEINGRMWMNSNLKTKKYANGTNISWNFDYCYPNNDLSNIDKYGVLYRWDIATENQASSNYPSGVQGICPDGWHIPSVVEWKSMLEYLQDMHQFQCGDCSECIAKSLSSDNGWAYSGIECTPGNNMSTNNTTGFSAMPAGCYYVPGQNQSGEITGFGTSAWFWCSDCGNRYASIITLNYQSEAYGVSTIYGRGMASVRCVKN